LQDDGVEADPDVILNHDRVGQDRLVVDGDIAALRGMGDGIDGRVPGDQDVTADGDAAIAVHQAEGTQPGALAQGDEAPVGIDDHSVIDVHPLAEADARVGLGIGPQGGIAPDAHPVAEVNAPRVLEVDPGVDMTVGPQRSEASPIPDPAPALPGLADDAQRSRHDGS
jgi:hypothetical protein